MVQLEQKHTESQVLEQLISLARTKDKKGLQQVVRARQDQLVGYEHQQDALEDPVDTVMAMGWDDARLLVALESVKGEKKLKKALWAVTKGLKPTVYCQMFDPKYWEQLSGLLHRLLTSISLMHAAGGELTVEQAAAGVGVACAPLAVERLDRLKTQLNSDGYFIDKVLRCLNSLLYQLSGAFELIADGW